MRPTMPFQVELFVYSGRPNPSWPLLPQQEEVLVDLLNQLPQGSFADHPLPNPLGYGGLVAIGDYRVWVYRESVWVVWPGKRKLAFRDEKRRVENFLLRTMRPYQEDVVQGVLYGRG